MTEKKKLKVEIGEEEDVAETYAAFGWEVVDTDEIDTRREVIDGVEVKEYGDDFFGSFKKGFTGKDADVKVKSHTEGEHYTLITFERDKDIKEHDRLVALEQKYESNIDSCLALNPKKPIVPTVIAVIILAAFIFALVGTISNEEAMFEVPMDYVVVIGMPLAFVIFGAYSIYMWKQYPKLVKLRGEYFAAAADAVNEGNEILGREPYQPYLQ